jgi:uncharacterized membrane protein YhaH (DUF805 family)
MNFFEAIRSCFSKYATFRGRALRSEFWYWFLFTLLASSGLGFVDVALGNSLEDPSLISIVFGLVIWLPTFAVTCRRYHDVNRSGWWIAIPTVAAIAAGIAFAIGSALGGGTSYLPMIPGILLALYTAFVFIRTIYWCFKRGDLDENDYGPAEY